MSEQNVGCLGLLFRLFPGLAADEKRDPALAELPKVMVDKYFISNAEADFFRVLRAVVGDRGYILAQVSLKQLLYFPGRGEGNTRRWQNKVAQKRICDPGMLNPKLVIELDEPSHSRPERQTRDDEVGMILKAAGLPVVRVLTSRTYDTRELAEACAPYL